VRNLQSGSITPQFHLVYDDYFETVHSREDQEPENWGELLRFGRFQSGYDESDDVPDLPDEWLNPQELADRTAMRQQEKDNIVQRHGGTVEIDEPDPVPTATNVPPATVAPVVAIPQPAPTVNAPPVAAPPRPPRPIRQPQPPPPDRSVTQGTFLCAS
jgi:hypothetical protein